MVLIFCVLLLLLFCWFFLLRKAVSHAQAFSPARPHEERSWTQSTFLAKGEELTQPVFCGMILFQSCPQLSVSQTPGVVWAKEGKGAPGQSPLVSCHPPAPWDWCTWLGWSGSYSAPSLGKKSYSIQCLSIVVGFETLVPRYTGQRCLESFSAIGS